VWFNAFYLKRFIFQTRLEVSLQSEGTLTNDVTQQEELQLL
jgi:hypothetical protein